MKLELYQSKNTNPHYNLALEQYLLETCPVDTVRFYLWQNEHTVVIGKNQHAQTEVHYEKLMEDKGTLARRTSGGGAVYHDLGNLNFSFIAYGSLFNITKQMEMMAETLRNLGYNAAVNGRNDIEVDGAKVSGNAFAHLKNQHLHHGTLLVNVYKPSLGKYLNVNPKKLQRKNVESVAARIANLNDIKPITIPTLIETLFATVQTYYQTYANLLPIPIEFDESKVKNFSSIEWLLGKQNNETVYFEDCFDFGCIKWMMEVKDGVIVNNHIYTDSMDTDWCRPIEKAVNGHKANETELLKVLNTLDIDEKLDAIINALAHKENIL
jgi:lipoate-protein ligase A